MPQIGQPFCQNVMHVVAGAGRKFARMTSDAISEIGAVLMVRPEEYPHGVSWNWSVPKPPRPPEYRYRGAPRLFPGGRSKWMPLLHAETGFSVDRDGTRVSRNVR